MGIEELCKLFKNNFYVNLLLFQNKNLLREQNLLLITMKFCLQFINEVCNKDTNIPMIWFCWDESQHLWDIDNQNKLEVYSVFIMCVFCTTQLIFAI
jgi:hypothetical protein